MARCDNSESLPNKIYFLQSYKRFNGPYTKKPTLLQRKNKGKIIEFHYNESSKSYVQIEA